MLVDVQITCVTKPDRNSDHDRITHVGGPAGGRWKWPAENVVASIETGTNTFFVIDAAGHRSVVGVVDPGNGRPKYLRTYADGDWNNNLLALPECP